MLCSLCMLFGQLCCCSVVVVVVDNGLLLFRKCLVRGRMLLGCLVNGGSVSLMVLRWQYRFLWNWLLWIMVGRLVLVVLIICILIWCLWLEFSCLKCLVLSMCSSFICLFSDRLLILFRNNVLLLVVLNLFLCVLLVLVQVFVLVLNSLVLISLDGIVLQLSVMNGFLVISELVWMILVIFFLLVLFGLVISIGSVEWVIWQVRLIMCLLVGLVIIVLCRL